MELREQRDARAAGGRNQDARLGELVGVNQLDAMPIDHRVDVGKPSSIGAKRMRAEPVTGFVGDDVEAADGVEDDRLIAENDRLKLSAIDVREQIEQASRGSADPVDAGVMHEQNRRHRHPSVSVAHGLVIRGPGEEGQALQACGS